MYPSLYQQVWQLLTHSQREEEKEWEETQARPVSAHMHAHVCVFACVCKGKESGF